MCRLQTHLCLNTQPPSSLVSFSLHVPFSLFLSLFESFTDTSTFMLLCTGISVCVCVCVFYVLCLHPEGVTRAIYACACDDVGARSEIYKRDAHTSLRLCWGDTFICPRSISRELQMWEGKRVSANILSISFFFRLMESSRSVVYWFSSYTQSSWPYKLDACYESFIYILSIAFL